MLAILVLGLYTSACSWEPSQGPQEQKRGTESQEMPGEQEITEETMETPQKSMEKTADEEQQAPPG